MCLNARPIELSFDDGGKITIAICQWNWIRGWIWVECVWLTLSGSVGMKRRTNKSVSFSMVNCCCYSSLSLCLFPVIIGDAGWRCVTHAFKMHARTKKEGAGQGSKVFIGLPPFEDVSPLLIFSHSEAGPFRQQRSWAAVYATPWIY